MRQHIKLGSIIQQIRGVSYKPTDVKSSEDPNAVALLRANNIQDEGLNFDDLVYVDKKKVNPEQMLRKGDIVICSSSGSKNLVGKAAVADRDLPYAFGAFCKVVRVIAMEADFVGQYFQCPRYRREISSASAGANINNIRNEHIDEMLIPVYSDAEQKEIARKLLHIDALIRDRRTQLAFIDQLVKSRFVEMFGAYSAKDCRRRIGDYADVLSGYAFKSDLFCTDAIPIIRISNINDGRVTLDYSTCFSQDFWEQNKQFRAEQMDIMMAMSGATTGKAGLYTSSQPALINQRVACIRALPNTACPAFLFVATQLKWMYELIQETSAGCAQPNISGKQITNIPVPDAAYEEQRCFAAFVEQVDKSKLCGEMEVAA